MGIPTLKIIFWIYIRKVEIVAFQLDEQETATKKNIRKEILWTQQWDIILDKTPQSAVLSLVC